MPLPEVDVHTLPILPEAINLLGNLVENKPIAGIPEGLPPVWNQLLAEIARVPFEFGLRGRWVFQYLATVENGIQIAADLLGVLPQENSQPPKNPSQRARIRVRSGLDALQDQPPVEWVIDNLFSRGSLNMIVGAPGSMKTFAMMSAAVCVAQGKPWLSRATTQTTALLIDEESGERRLMRRLGDLIRGESGDWKTPVYSVSRAHFNLMVPEDLIILHKLIEKTGAGFVVIDALADIMPGLDENSVRETLPILNALHQLAETTRSAIVVIHHTNKSGGYRGSTAICGAVDLMLLVEPKNEKRTLMFKPEKVRDVELDPFTAIPHFEDGRVWFTAMDPNTTVRPSVETGKFEKFVLDFLKHQPDGAQLNEIAKGQPVEQYNSIRNALNTLRAKGLVIRINEGGKGKQAVYSLVSTVKK